jgi:hypothetical protein
MSAAPARQGLLAHSETISLDFDASSRKRIGRNVVAYRADFAIRGTKNACLDHWIIGWEKTLEAALYIRTFAFPLHLKF